MKPSSTLADPVDEDPAAYEVLRHLASANAVVLLSSAGCCMSHVVKQLLLGLGVGPAIVQLDPSDAFAAHVIGALRRLPGGGDHRPVPIPAVFVGGKFLGGIEAVMACHINGTLVPLLKEAGALWL